MRAGLARDILWVDDEEVYRPVLRCSGGYHDVSTPVNRRDAAALAPCRHRLGLCSHRTAGVDATEGARTPGACNSKQLALLQSESMQRRGNRV